MQLPAIVLGDPDSILRLPKAALKNPGNWTQSDSDTIAHLIQVHSQIQQSQWCKSECRFKTQRGQLLESQFPDFEDFVFAAVYFRQLIAKNDLLFKEAVDRYCRAVDCDIRSLWVQHELRCFDSILSGKSMMLAVCTVCDLFEAFLYGAGLFHTFPGENDKKRRRFLDLCDNHPREQLIFALNTSLRLLLNHVSAATVVIHRDYSHWLHDYNLPKPDTRWHKHLFDVKPRA